MSPTPKEFLDKVRAYDRGWYAMSLFLPERQREMFWAALALQAELTHISQVTTTADTALLRCVWWRDRITALFSGETAPAHPTLQALEAMRAGLGEVEPWLEMISAMGMWFTEDAPQDWPAFGRFAAAYYSPLAHVFQTVEQEALTKSLIAYGMLKERERMARALSSPRLERLPFVFLTRLQEARSNEEVMRVAGEELNHPCLCAQEIIFNTNHLLASPDAPYSNVFKLNVYTANKKLSFHKSCKFNELSYRSSRFALGLLGGLYRNRLLRKF